MQLLATEVDPSTTQPERGLVVVRCPRAVWRTRDYGEHSQAGGSRSWSGGIIRHFRSRSLCKITAVPRTWEVGRAVDIGPGRHRAALCVQRRVLPTQGPRPSGSGRRRDPHAREEARSLSRLRPPKGSWRMYARACGRRLACRPARGSVLLPSPHTSRPACRRHHGRGALRRGPGKEDCPDRRPVPRATCA